MKRLLLALITGLALACVANASYAQHHMGGFHGPSAGFHGGGFHHGGFQHFHDGRFHRRFAFFIGAPFFWGAPFGYAAWYGAPQQGYSYYCPGQGYYPEVQSCFTGWLRVVPGAY